MNTLPIAGDVLTAATAFAGLMLVFIGATATSYDSYSADEQSAVKNHYRTRAGLGLLGFVASLLASVGALVGNWLNLEWPVTVAVVLLGLSFLAVLVAAIQAFGDIK